MQHHTSLAQDGTEEKNTMVTENISDHLHLCTYVSIHKNICGCFFLSVKESWSLGLPTWLGSTVAHAGVASFPGLQFSQCGGNISFWVPLLLCFQKCVRVIEWQGCSGQLNDSVLCQEFGKASILIFQTMLNNWQENGRAWNSEKAAVISSASTCLEVYRLSTFEKWWRLETSNTQPIGQSRSVCSQQSQQFADYRLRSSPSHKIMVMTMCVPFWITWVFRSELFW